MVTQALGMSASAPPQAPLQQTSIVLQPEEFAYDEEHNLGRANGNTYQRRPGVDNVHDGQIMVRLKKKRFIIIDYGYVPKPEDYAISDTTPHITIPEGAGQQRCATKNCPRVGVPVLLYDSEPSEAMSLYIRGGLCFCCQRAVNEKRRTKRKTRSEDFNNGGGIPFGEVRLGSSGDMRSIGSSGSRFKVNNDVVELNSDAIIINGAVAGTRSRGPGYQHAEIGPDLRQIVSELSEETMSLVSNSDTSSPATANALYQKAFLSASKVTYLLTQWKASYDEHAYATAAAAVSAVPAVATGHGYNYDPNNTNGGTGHHLYGMNATVMNNAAASTYGMNPVQNINQGLIGVPTLAHVPRFPPIRGLLPVPPAIAANNNSNNGDSHFPSENSRNAEV